MVKQFIPIEIKLDPRGTDKEIFFPRDLYDLKPYYWISNYGRIINKYTMKEIKGEISNSGHRRVGLMTNSNRHLKLLVHRLVAIYFVEGFNEDLCVNHKDGNKLNNFYKNLEWTTIQENTIHAFKNNLINVSRGQSHYKNKYDEDLIIQICELLQDGYMQSEIKITKIK